jgi:deazaflavin-dependent oxidoreductase (nitroreductase family)
MRPQIEPVGVERTSNRRWKAHRVLGGPKEGPLPGWIRAARCARSRSPGTGRLSTVARQGVPYHKPCPKTPSRHAIRHANVEQLMKDPRQTRLRSAVDEFNRTFTRVHTWVYVKTRGWLGHRWTVAPPSLLLHTTGRKSGLRRSVALAYARDGEDLLIVGSNFGQDRPPGWLLNLRARSAAEVNVGHRRIAVVADIVEPSDRRYQRLFEIANERNRGRYYRYRSMTDRPIPVVALSPRPRPSQP